MRDGISTDSPWRFFDHSRPNRVRLPKLYQGYSLKLSFLETRARSARVIRFEDEESELSPEPSISDHESSRSGGAEEVPENNHEPEKQAERASPNKICASPEPDARTPNLHISRNKQWILSLWQYPSRLITTVVRSIVPPVILICAIHVVLSRTSYLWKPLDSAKFPLSNAHHQGQTGFQSVLGLGRAAIPRPTWELKTGVEPSMATRESHMEPLSSAGMQQQEEDQFGTNDACEPEHQPSASKARSVMDWIDRALGWKNITQ